MRIDPSLLGLPQAVARVEKFEVEYKAGTLQLRAPVGNIYTWFKRPSAIEDQVLFDFARSVYIDAMRNGRLA